VASGDVIPTLRGALVASAKKNALSSSDLEPSRWQVLIVRGDSGDAHGSPAQPGSDQSPSEPNEFGPGPFGTSLDLLESGLLTRRGIRSVGVCGHPEGIGSDVSIDEVSGESTAFWP